MDISEKEYADNWDKAFKKEKKEPEKPKEAKLWQKSGYTEHPSYHMDIENEEYLNNWDKTFGKKKDIWEKTLGKKKAEVKKDAPEEVKENIE